MKKLIKAQFIVLLIGFLFAWTNFTIEMISWLNKKACVIGCAEKGTIPFLTPCFGGAIFFTIALILSISILKKFKKDNVSSIQ
jgi:hypothetical protein